MRIRPWEDARTAANGQSIQANFANWSHGNQLLDDAGAPMTFYRGHRRAPLDDGFKTTNGRATTSFTTDLHVANVYARQLETREYGGGSTIIPVYMVMRQPLNLYNHGEQLTLEDLVMSLPNVDLEEEIIDGGVGYLDLANAIRGFDSVIYKTNASYEIEAGDGAGYRIRDFSELADRIEDLGGEGDCDGVSNLLYDVKFDTYLVADSKNMTKLLKKLGFDGVIHADVFDAGIKHYEGDKSNFEEGSSSEAVITTYRPFHQSQIKSAVGNCGLFLRDAYSLTDRDAALALASAQEARDVMEKMSKGALKRALPS